MLQKKNEGILFPTEIRVVGSYTDRLLSLNARYSEIIASHADVLSAHQAILRSWERNAWRIPKNVCVGGILVSSARVYIEKHLQLKYTVSMPDCVSRTLLLENI